MTTQTEIKVGDRVSIRGTPHHNVGTVQELRPGAAYVRWHRGYAAWSHATRLVVVPRPTNDVARPHDDENNSGGGASST